MLMPAGRIGREAAATNSTSVSDNTGRFARKHGDQGRRHSAGQPGADTPTGTRLPRRLWPYYQPLAFIDRDVPLRCPRIGRWSTSPPPAHGLLRRLSPSRGSHRRACRPQFVVLVRRLTRLGGRPGIVPTDAYLGSGRRLREGFPGDPYREGPLRARRIAPGRSPLRLAAAHGNRRGACGRHSPARCARRRWGASVFWQHLPWLESFDEVCWNVVERPEIVAAGRRRIDDPRVRFFDSIPAAIAEGAPDLAIGAGLLPLVPDPFGLTEQIAATGARLVFLDRIAVVDAIGRDACTRQVVPPWIYESDHLSGSSTPRR